ncbi:MAG: 8-amino-7-oxononanoate synthase [Candidatus Melainabacteria bacterium RIFOXYA12_FULL_32_12]|nr:MAG: 8-amino-7-oxononanoate synthase [Candidatus Melainabacteria bacterium RIFOXYA2_FULL_32_9]OGI31394.1 MAG: 8-amino-7-oxononanoate synthase [Candidatus Melainabacteria bacterium RIFOXYA12_FULL_32_12]
MSSEFYNFLEENLKEIKTQNLYRDFKPVSSKSGPYITYKDKKILQMSSNNYLGLAGDERLQEAAIKAIEKYGIGSTGSRLISGTHELHLELEDKIAKFKNTEKALVFSTGYAANLGTIAGLLNENDAVYSDQLNHASIIDGIKLSRANKFIYKHCDISDLEKLISENHQKYRFNVIITDTIFSMDGDRAPLKEIVELKEKYEAILFVDEAHAFGVYGPNGQGLAHEFGINDKVDIQMGTLSKAAGVEGGYIAGKKELINYLIHKSRSFIYSTAPTIPSIAASIKAIEIIKKADNLRDKLYQNINYLRSELNKIQRNGNIIVIPSNSAIFCMRVGDTERTIKFSKKLLEEHQILATAIRPPTVETSRIRLCTMALHRQQDLDYLLEKLSLEISSQF